MIRATIASAELMLWFQPMLQCGADCTVDHLDQLGVVQPILRLPLELGVGHENAQHTGEPLADVVRRERYPLRRQVVRLDEVADGLAQAGAKAGLVGAAGTGWDAVDIAADRLVGRLGPLQRYVDPGPALGMAAREDKRGVVHRRGVQLPDDAREIVGQAIVVSERFTDPPRLVVEDELDAAMDIARDLYTFPEQRRVERRLREDARVGTEPDRRAGAARRLHPGERPGRLAAPERLPPDGAVAFRLGDQLLRQRVDDARADAVETAGGPVVLVLELPAGVQGGEDHLKGALAAARVLIDRDAAAVVGHRDRRAVRMQRQPDLGGEAVHRLVDGVVEEFPGQVVQTGGSDAADVHAGTLADRCKAFENGDVFRRV